MLSCYRYGLTIVGYSVNSVLPYLSVMTCSRGSASSLVCDKGVVIFVVIEFLRHRRGLRIAGAHLLSEAEELKAGSDTD